MTINTQRLRDQLDIVHSDQCEDETQFEAAQQIIAAAPELLDRADRVEALDIIVLSVAAALARHGVKDADDPGEAIDVLVADKDREIARLKAAQTWQPIETAPKDGSTVLLRGRGDHRIADGSWLQAAYGGLGAWVWPYVHSEPHHWMPLPAGPSALSGGAS